MSALVYVSVCHPQISVVVVVNKELEKRVDYEGSSQESVCVCRYVCISVDSSQLLAVGCRCPLPTCTALHFNIGLDTRDHRVI